MNLELTRAGHGATVVRNSINSTFLLQRREIGPQVLNFRHQSVYVSFHIIIVREGEKRCVILSPVPT